MVAKFLRILLLLLFCLPLPARATVKALAELEKTPLPDIQVPKIDRKTLKSGMRLFLLKDDELPVVRGYLFIRTGSIYESPDKLGVAALTGSVLRTGGTRKLSPGEFNEALASLGAEIHTGIKREFGYLSFQCLSEDLPKVLDLVFQLLREPAFDESRLNLSKLQMAEELRRENDQPEEIAMREYPKIIYGKDNVWSRTPTVADVKKLTRQDVVEFYHRYFHPDRMIFALAGDFKEKNLEVEFEKLSEGWEKSKTPMPKITPLKKSFSEGVYQIEKGTDQTTILIGHMGEKRFNPDKYALLLLNDILGGDVMGSRLGNRIRSSLGLAYGIYSTYGLQTDYGIFYVFVQTKAGNTRQVLKETKKILQNIAEGRDLTEAELEEHKRSVVNSLYSQYEPRFNFVKDEARFAYFGYPPNYLEYFRKKIQGVTLDELRRAAKKYLKPGSLQVLVVGDTNKIGKLPGAEQLSLEAM